MRQVLPPIIAFVVLIGLWAAGAHVLAINPILLPSPTQIAQAVIVNYRSLLYHSFITMSEAVGGFLLGSFTAYCLAILFVYSPIIRSALFPYAVALKSTPLIAVAPIVVLWFGNMMLSKVVMASLVAFFPVLVNSIAGLSAPSVEALDLMKSLSASNLQILVKLRLPSSLEYLIAGLKTASSLAVVGALIGEFTGATEGIGHLINTSSYYLETPLMFAGVLMVSLSGIGFFAAVSYLGHRIVFWERLK